MVFSNVPIWLVDLLGSATMIVFSFLSMRLAFRLRNRDRNNVIWTYLLWVSYGLAGFAISRSAGHILKQVLFITDRSAIWNEIRPLSGAINTLTPRNTISKNATGMVCAGFLVEVERADLDKLRRKYPEAFKRPYHPAAGLCLERVLVGGDH